MNRVTCLRHPVREEGESCKGPRETSNSACCLRELACGCPDDRLRHVPRAREFSIASDKMEKNLLLAPTSRIDMTRSQVVLFAVAAITGGTSSNAERSRKADVKCSRRIMFVQDIRKAVPWGSGGVFLGSSALSTTAAIVMLQRGHKN